MYTLKISLNWFSVDLPNVKGFWSHFICCASRSPPGWNIGVASIKTWLNHDVFCLWAFVDIDCNSLFYVIDCETIHTRVVIILDFISSTVMLTAAWTLLSAATLMSLIFVPRALISVVQKATSLSCMFLFFYNGDNGGDCKQIQLSHRCLNSLLQKLSPSLFELFT